ncbi:MAG: GIY-YIG nuclease family protein [Roseiarcus sp.]
MADGYVYVLVSANSEYVKIGKTEKHPYLRLKEINCSENYVESGPWDVSDSRQVRDCQAVETLLHHRFQDRRVHFDAGADELFAVAPVEARRALDAIEPAMLSRRDVVDRLTGDRDFSLYITKLFAFSGLPAWLNIQGAWTFALFPSTGRGRFFTLNIGNHEVAFSTLAHTFDAHPVHMLVVDRLINDFQHVRQWLEEHGGGMEPARYASALPRATCLFYACEFAEAEKVLALDGVRRALIAYWTEALIGLRERGSLSLFARYHNYNAVAKIIDSIRREERFFSERMASKQHGRDSFADTRSAAELV